MSIGINTKTFERMAYIEQSIKAMPNTFYKAKECKKEVLDFYISSSHKLSSVKDDQFNNFSFTSQVLDLSEHKKKATLVDRVKKRVLKLERHSYAPEMNNLHFNNGETFKTPQVIDINEAIKYYMLKSSVEQIQSLCNRVKCK